MGVSVEVRLNSESAFKCSTAAEHNSSDAFDQPVREGWCSNETGYSCLGLINLGAF